MAFYPRELEHKQDMPASEWVVTHNFGRTVAADVYVQLQGNSKLVKVIPSEVILTDENTLTIQFGYAVAGKAIIR